MIDPALSDRLHDLAESIEPSFDLSALHRRMAVRTRRRHAVKAGAAGIGIAAIAGGLLVVGDRQPDPTTGSALEQPTGPSAMAACDVVLAGLRAAIPTPDVEAAARAAKAERSGSAATDDVIGERGFKGVVTILSTEGSQIAFRVDEADPSATSSGAAVLDSTTTWLDDGTALATPSVLKIGNSSASRQSPAPTASTTSSSSTSMHPPRRTSRPLARRMRSRFRTRPARRWPRSPRPTRPRSPSRSPTHRRTLFPSTSPARRSTPATTGACQVSWPWARSSAWPSTSPTAAP